MAEKSKIRFVCGKQTFTLKRDPDTGRWDHDSHALKTVHLYQRDGMADNFKIVDVVCEMLSDGLTTPDRGVAAAKKMWKIANRERPCIKGVVPEVVMAYLKMESFDSSVAALWNPDLRSGSASIYHPDNFHRSSERWSRLLPPFDPDVNESAWLRHAMAACDSMRGSEPYDDTEFNPEQVVTLIVPNLGSAWLQDLKLWPDYLEWAFRYPQLQTMAMGTLPKLYGERDLSRLRDILLHEIVAGSESEAQNRCFGQPGSELWRVLSTHASEYAPLCLSNYDNGNIGLRMGRGASVLWAAQYGEPDLRLEALLHVAWSVAISELQAACREAGGFVLAGRGQTPLHTVFADAFERAGHILEMQTPSDEASQWVQDMSQSFGHPALPRQQHRDDYRRLFDDF